MEFFTIFEQFGTNGFFAKFNNVLSGLNEADKLGLIPFIDYQTNHSNLYDPTNTEIKNEWEYCFIQDYDYDIVYNSRIVKSHSSFNGWPPPQEKNFRNKELVSRLNFLYEKYIKVKPEILSKLNNEITNFKTLAVHCRRSDMEHHHSNIALKYSDELFFEKTMKIFNDGNFEKIYLATEEISIIEFFKEKIGEQLFYQDCFRVYRNDSPVHKNDERHNHRTLQCQEVLIDALNMSKCDSLLCGISGVSNATTYINGLKFNNVFYFDEI
jgi:hypothetical protein